MGNVDLQAEISASITPDQRRRHQAERVADQARDRLASLVAELAAANDPDKIRDLAIGVTVLSEAIEKLDGLAQREVVHLRVLQRWTRDVGAILTKLTGRELEDLRYGSYRFDLNGPIVIDRGEGEPTTITEREFWNLLEGTFAEMRDRLPREMAEDLGDR